MKLVSSLFMMLALAISSPAFATVVVNAPANGATVGSTVQFAASGNTPCKKGVAAMGVYVDNSLVYQVNGASLNAAVTISPGSHQTAVQEWDFCGGASSTSLTLNVNNQAGVTVISPANGSTVTAAAPFSATATTSCPSGVAAMGVYVNGSLAATQPGAKLNTTVPLSSGKQTAVVQSWDNCGGSSKAPVTVNVASGNKLANLQAVGGWDQWGELNPTYDICDAPCGGGVNWSMYQHQSANSLSGNATTYNMGGSQPYSDVLWSLKLIGQGTKLGLPDSKQTLLPAVHHMTYDTDVWVGNLAVAQDLEFDVNIFMNGVGMEWGTECNHLNGGVWDIWNNVNTQWVHTSIPCTITNQQWNHVSFTVQRETNNDLTYQTLTVNGVTYNINQTVAPFQVPKNWYGMTANYQMDGNSRQSAYTTMLDNLSVTYW